jgi:hypothetical protein
MTDTLGVASLFDDVSARFAAEGAVVSVLDLGAWSALSTSTPSLSGAPTADADARVRFPAGGTIGTPGITYQTSTDGGVTWATTAALGAGSTITVAGVTLTLGAGDVFTDDALAWLATGPAVVTEFAFGWRASANRSSAFRVVFTPGSDGDLGELLPPLQLGGNPRSVADLGELFTVHLEARDATAPQDERKQYTAARLLFDAAWAYMRDAATALLELVDARWVGGGGTLGAQSQSGATIRLTCALRVPIPRETRLVISAATDALVATTAVVEDSGADQTDHDTVNRSDTP